MVRALIVDDNADNLGVLSEVLTMEGVDTVTVQNPRHLSSVLANDTGFDVIFLDLEMPGIDGYEIFQGLQADPHLRAVPVVAYTVHVSEMNAARDLGFHSFLGKPINMEQFPAQLERILRGEPVWAIP